MKVVILAGGLPSTIADEEGIPKPLLEIGERPLLWHIMKLYSFYGYEDFIICAGYKGELLKRYFMDYYIYQSDITIDLEANQVKIHQKKTENWNVTVVDTGLHTPILERILRIRRYIEEEAFIVSYGDCISNLQVTDMVDMYERKSRMAVAAVAKPAGRHHLVSVEENGDICREKRGQTGGAQAWVDACNMVLSTEIFDCLSKASSQKELFEELGRRGEITMYRHPGFWRAVETMRDRAEMEELWQSGQPPWRVWRD